MAITKKDMHVDNVMRLLLPLVSLLAVSSVSLAAGAVVHLYDAQYAYLLYGISVGAMVLTLPTTVVCLARVVDYNRARLELMRASASSVFHPRFDKLVNRLYQNRGRQLALAMAISGRSLGPPVEDALVLIRERQRDRDDFLKKPHLLSAGWWAAMFSPADLR